MSFPKNIKSSDRNYEKPIEVLNFDRYTCIIPDIGYKTMYYQDINSPMILWDNEIVDGVNYDNGVLLFNGNIIVINFINEILLNYSDSNLLLIGDNNTLVNGRTPSLYSPDVYKIYIQINDKYIKLILSSNDFLLETNNISKTTTFTDKLNFDNYDYEGNIKQIISEINELI